jgi:hypothetical protein
MSDIELQAIWRYLQSLPAQSERKTKWNGSQLARGDWTGAVHLAGLREK